MAIENLQFHTPLLLLPKLDKEHDVIIPGRVSFLSGSTFELTIDRDGTLVLCCFRDAKVPYYSTSEEAAHYFYFATHPFNTVIRESKPLYPELVEYRVKQAQANILVITGQSSETVAVQYDNSHRHILNAKKYRFDSLKANE